MRYRIASLLLCAAAAFAVTAAPAPVYKPKPNQWLGLDGWDSPVDHSGDCRFHCEGNRLKLAVHGRNRQPNQARLVRQVDGDFVVKVRVGGDFHPAALKGGGIYRRAGIVVSDGRSIFKLQRSLSRNCESDEFGLELYFYGETNGKWRNKASQKGPSLKRPAYLCMERRGENLLLGVSTDGLKWGSIVTSEGLLADDTFRMKRQVKVGVIAETNARGIFEPVFEWFQLAKPGPEPAFDTFEAWLLRFQIE